MDLFRFFFAIILITAFVMSGAFRRRARRTGAIPRSREGGAMLAMRLVFALPFFLAMAAYIINPRWMDWSALALPEAARWAGVAIGLAVLPVLYWVLRSIGRNISETVLTKWDHALVTHGPYRWVRHPMYVVLFLYLLSILLVTSNLLIGGFLLGSFLFTIGTRVAKEEAILEGAYGEEYRTYKSRTGRFWPRARFST